jgi:hypothetical protein
MADTLSTVGSGRNKRNFGLFFALAGFFMFLVGAQPSMFGLDISPITGFIQISVFTIGLGIMCLGGFWCLSSLWNGSPKSIVADIGLRLVATGYLISFSSALADLVGFGSQATSPTFGDWQKLGVILGQAVIAVGFILMLPFGQEGRPGERPED